MSETPMNKLRELCENWAECTDLAAIRKTATPETRAQATGWKQCAAELRAILPDVERLLEAPSRILTVSLYRSLERLSIAIEGCGKIGFEESKPTTNEQHGQIWLELNDAQKDAKLKLKHYGLALFNQPVAPVERLVEALRLARKFVRGRLSYAPFGPQSLLDEIDAALALFNQPVAPKETK